jgi:hypothetical protein
LDTAVVPETRAVLESTLLAAVHCGLEYSLKLTVPEAAELNRPEIPSVAWSYSPVASGGTVSDAPCTPCHVWLVVTVVGVGGSIVSLSEPQGLMLGALWVSPL